MSTSNPVRVDLSFTATETAVLDSLVAHLRATGVRAKRADAIRYAVFQAAKTADAVQAA